MARKCKMSKDTILLIAMILGMSVGIGMGVGLRYVEPRLNEREIMYLEFPGEILMRMLKLLILPLIMSSLIAGVASLNAPGVMGLRTVIYYVCTTVIAVFLGLLMVLSIKPGEGGDGGSEGDPEEEPEERINAVDAMLDLVRNMLPDNIVTACFEMTRTVEKKTGEYRNETDDNGTIVEKALYSPDTGTVRGLNILGIVVFALSMGVVISRLKEKGKPLLYFCESLNEATMVLVTVVIWYSPIGVCFLIAAKIAEVDDLEELMKQIGLYIITVISGLLIHAIIIIPIIYVAMTRRNPFKFMLNMMQAIITAFATASSSATLPVTFNCLEDNCGVDKRVSRFVLPIGATINMDGTALYEAVAAIFIAQYNNIELSPVQYFIISLTATLTSIGAAGIPSAGLVTLIIVLTAVGLPTDDVGMLLAVDWLVDRVRTAVNVWGDSVGAGVVYSLSSKELQDTGDDDNSIASDYPKDEESSIEDIKRVPKGWTNSAYETEDTWIHL